LAGIFGADSKAALRAAPRYVPRSLGRCGKITDEETVSRKGAKGAELAKKTNDFGFALLCDLATLRELFWFFHTI